MNRPRAVRELMPSPLGALLSQPLQVRTSELSTATAQEFLVGNDRRRRCTTQPQSVLEVNQSIEIRWNGFG
jgi:hypothetical protein